MPIVNIDWIEGRSLEQRRALAQEITRAVVNVANCSPDAVTIIFNDHPKEGIAKGGKLFLDE